MKKFALLTLVSIILIGGGCSFNVTKTEHDDTENDTDAIAEEIQISTLDSDGDGITDYDEIELYQTDPYDSDTDGDGYLDGDEIADGYDPDEPAVTTIVEEDVTFDEPGLTLNVDEVTTTIDCGAEASCFDEKFAACEPSTMTSDASGWVAVSYEITGPADEGCAVTMIYTTNPNPEWQDKPLYCVYDNTKDFEVAMMEAFESAMNTDGYCSGPLNDVFHAEDRGPIYESGSGEVIQVN